MWMLLDRDMYFGLFKLKGCHFKMWRWREIARDSLIAIHVFNQELNRI